MIRGGVRSAGMLVGLLVLLSVACAAVDIVINEIAWAGTAASANDEWIELHNTTDVAIDLAGWTLRFDTDSTVVHLGEVAGDTLELRRAIIESDGYFLLERTDDTTVSDVEADLIYKGTLSNAGMFVELLDPAGAVADSVDGTAEGWPAGRASDETPSYATMEQDLSDERDIIWVDADPRLASGLDANGNPLCGTPRAENAVAVLRRVAPQVDWTTPPRTLGFVSGLVVVEWSAVDPDGLDEAIQISISLLPSEGGAPFPVAEQLANAGSYEMNTLALPDGFGKLVIYAEDADGFGITTASEEFEIRNTP